jgi:hypothetical protein
VPRSLIMGVGLVQGTYFCDDLLTGDRYTPYTILGVAGGATLSNIEKVEEKQNVQKKTQ